MPSISRSSPLLAPVVALVVAAGALSCGPIDPEPADCGPCTGEVRTGCEDLCSEPDACAGEEGE